MTKSRKEAKEVAAEKSLLPLDQPRSVAMRAGDRLVTWHFRRITAQDWTKFFESIVNRTLRHNGIEERVFDADAVEPEAAGDGGEVERRREIHLRVANLRVGRAQAAVPP